MSASLRRSLALGAALSLLSAFAASAAAPPAIGDRDRVWPQSYSDLPADPDIRFGVLANGMRYALMHNDTPKGEVSLRLRIGSGSLEEDDAEQGLAHMLEHMAFKGSVHAPGADNEIIKRLERLGLSFGGDTNAHTGWDDTGYQLDLPNDEPQTVDTGLTFLADVGSGLLIKPEALATERGVVLSEERLRDTPDYEVAKARLDFLLKGQLAASRFPIGKVAVIQTAPASLLRRFYDANYRPDRAVLVAVGDFDVAAMQAKVEQLFGGWRGVGPETPAPDLGKPAVRQGATQLIVRKGAAPSLAIAWATPPDEAADSFAKERRDFIENLAFAALNRRLQRVAHAPDPPFLSAAAGRSETLRSARIAELSVSFKPGEWRPAMVAAVRLQRQALQYGFSQAEVDREVTEAGVRFRNAAASASTRRTPTLAEEVIRTVDDREVDTSPAEDLKLFGQFTTGLSAAEVDAALRKTFEGDGPLVSLATPDPVDGGEGAVAAAFRETEAAPVAAPAALQALSWTHTNFGADGQVVERREVPDLHVTFVRFANGVRLTLRPSALRKDQVLVSAHFGLGRLGLPRERVVPDWALSSFVAGGLQDLTYEDVQQVLADRTASVGLGVDDDAFSLSGATRTKDLQLQLQLLAAYMTVPGWRPEAFTRTQALTGVALEQLSATPQGVEARDLVALQHDGDARWRTPTPDDVRAARLNQLKALLQPELGHAPREVVITGDTTVEDAIRAVAATFGALPAARDEPIPPGGDQVRFPQGGGAPIVRLDHGRPDQAIAYVAWPATDLLSDPLRARRINIAAEVLQLRLTDRVRVAEGASYSPSAGASESETFPGYGDVFAGVETPPTKIAGFYADVAKITADMRERGVTDDELRRAVKPRIEEIERAQQTNTYWLSMLHDAQDDPRRLALIRTSIPQYRAITIHDVQATAQAYLVDAHAWRFQVQSPTPAAGPTDAVPLPLRAPPRTGAGVRVTKPLNGTSPTPAPPGTTPSTPTAGLPPAH